MSDLNKTTKVWSGHRKLTLTSVAFAVALAGFAMPVQAGKITSVPSASGASGFGGWNLGNVDIVLYDDPTGSAAPSTFDETTGLYVFGDDADFTYEGHVYDDDVGTTTLGKALAKDWPVGEPAGIKIVNDDFDVKEGKATNCIMSTSYLADHYLDSADPIQVPCSGPFQSHKRYKLAMLPTTVEDAVAGTGPEKGIDLVFNVEADGTSRDYQVFQKINNWTDERLEGFTVQVGTGLGANFVPAADITTGVGIANLSVFVPEVVWNASQLANFSSGLFGPADPKHGRDAGYFDPVNPAGFFIDEYPNLTGATDTLTATRTLGSDYADVPTGALVAANQFGPWLPDNMLPYGIFFDDDNNPETDAELIAWYGYNPDPAVAGLGWMEGAATNFAEVPDAEIINRGANLAYTMGEIDDLVNVGLNYVVTVGDISSFPGYNADPALNSATFTIRITPTKDTSGTLEPAYVAAGIPTPSLEFTSSEGVAVIDPNPTFNIGDILTARVGDADLDTTTGPDEVVVAIESTTGLSGTLTLIEQGDERGVFAAVLPAEYSDVPVGVAATVTMTYVDADDGLGGVDVDVVATTSTEVALPAGTLQFDPVTYSVAENDGSVEVTVTRTDGSAGVATVSYMTVSGTAIGGQDYVADDGILTFGDGVLSQTITVVILNDSVVEADKTFTIQLSNTQVADDGADDLATITITDADIDAPAPVKGDGIFGFGWITSGLVLIGLLGRVRRKTS